MNIPLRGSSSHGLRWRWAPFEWLTAVDVYDMLRLRQDIFVLEQRCLYRDIDGRDRQAFHGLGTTLGGELVAYARVLPPTPERDEPSIGRVVVAQHWRGKGVGRELMQTAIEFAGSQFQGRSVRISAQAHLEQFYASLGFVRLSPNYDDDGIPHCDMRRSGEP
ncbi:MAG TPA: GNAT family N-acetyltransferase [Polyangiaceae bacterium]|nr:GNAT family N-acetyltransferase [Polyangiaceae bacterium]